MARGWKSKTAGPRISVSSVAGSSRSTQRTPLRLSRACRSDMRSRSLRSVPSAARKYVRSIGSLYAAGADEARSEGLEAQGGADLVDGEARDVGERGHPAQHQERPLPAAGLAAHHRQGRDALHREDEEDEEGDPDQGPEHGPPRRGVDVGGHRLPDRPLLVLLVGPRGVDDPEGADEHLPRG